jgi:FkbM family methyltransferase
MEDGKQRLEQLPGGKVVVVEAGASHGQQTTMITECAVSHGIDRVLELHAFEPSSAAFRALSRAVQGAQGQSQVTINNVALGDRAGEVTLHCFDSVGGGISCISERRFRELQPLLPSTKEVVGVTTFDDYIRTKGILHVTLLKTDTEGHEMSVLEGAKACLENRAIDYIEFEYNSTWIHERRFLAEAFELILPYGYRIGKLRPRGVEEFTCWDYRLEWFEQCNYVAWLNTLSPRFDVDTTTNYL